MPFEKRKGNPDIVFGLLVGIAVGVLLTNLIGPTLNSAATIITGVTGSQEASLEQLNDAKVEQAKQQSADFINNEMASVKPFKDRMELLGAALKFAPPKGIYCEFGVGSGRTINHIASIATSQKIHGFDSFEGLPENWREDYGKGAFSTGGTLPKVNANVVLYKGWFDKSIPPFRDKFPEPMAFMHMDADLYSSTKTVFDLLGDRIVPGTVLVFDEFFNYPGWQHGEFQAFRELVETRKFTFEYLGYSHGNASMRPSRS